MQEMEEGKDRRFEEKIPVDLFCSGDAQVLSSR